jgi:hypothetical protein
MSVYKEIGYAVREIEKQSVQIYPDACDFGVPVKSFDDPIVKMIKGVIEQYNLKSEIITYPTGSTQVTNFDGGWPAVLEAGFESCTIRYITTRGHKGMKGYITVNHSTSNAAWLQLVQRQTAMI